MDMKIIINRVLVLLSVCTLLTACGGGEATQSTRTAVFVSSAEAKVVVQEIVDALLIPEVIVFDLVDALALVLEGSEPECGNAPFGQATFDIQSETRVVAEFSDCQGLTNGVNFIPGTLNGTVTTSIISDQPDAQEFNMIFNGFRLDDPEFPFGVEGNVRLSQITQPDGNQDVRLTSNDFALLFDGAVLRFVELDRQSQVTAEGTEQLDFRGLLDGFGFEGVAGFDSVVPIVFDLAAGDIDQGILVVDGFNSSTIRITDSDMPNIANVEIDFDGDGVVDVIERWTWFGDIFP